MDTNLKMAQDLIFGKTGLGASNIKMFPGSDREVTPDMVAAELYRSIERLVGGSLELASDS